MAADDSLDPLVGGEGVKEVVLEALFVALLSLSLIIGLKRTGDRDVRQVAAQLHLYRNTRNMARILREKIMQLAGRNT